MTQYCTTPEGQPTTNLSPTCDNITESEQVDINSPEEIIKASLITKVPESQMTQIDSLKAQLASDIENLLNKYPEVLENGLDTPIEKAPVSFQRELENLERIYREKATF